MISVAEENQKICHDLSQLGIELNSIYDLLKWTDQEYWDGIPILIEWLDKVETNRIREGIVRSLTLRKAPKEVIDAIIYHFRKYAKSSNYKPLTGWAFGNAIGEVATSKQLEEVISLVEDETLEDARQMMVIGLGKIGKKAATHTFPVLVKLLEEPGVQGHAIAALGYLGDVRAIEYVPPFLEHKMKWIAKEAAKTIRKLEKTAKKVPKL